MGVGELSKVKVGHARTHLIAYLQNRQLLIMDKDEKSGSFKGGGWGGVPLGFRMRRVDA